VNGVALFVGVFAILSALAQFDAGPASAAARDYSFTISTALAWTDTGVDLQAGELLEITASLSLTQAATAANAPSGESCGPGRLSGAGKGNGSLPVATAPAGALIAKLHPHGAGVLVGSRRQLKVDAPGHLFFGVNAPATPACGASFAVKVHLTGSGSAPPTASATNPTSSHAAGAAAPSKLVPAQDTKSKLASAAEVFLAGQFGTGAAPSSSAAPTSDDLVSPNTANRAPTASALSVSNAALDSTLQKDIDGLPRRVKDEFNNQGDMLNFVLVGSERQVQNALEAASWHIADTDTKVAALRAALETYQKKDYLEMPMSQLYLFGRKQDFGYEEAEAYSVVASRHHFRIWKAPFTWNGQSVWAGAGTHDIGFERDQRNGKITHKIDPAVDGERDNIGLTLQKSGKVKSLAYYLPPNPVQEAKNATGGGYRSDGRILVVVLE
jgi:hypothetical protein